MDWILTAGLYVDFGSSGRPVRAVRKPPKRGARAVVPVERQALDGPTVHVVYRLGSRVAIGAGTRGWAERVFQGLGSKAAAYEIAAVPVVLEAA
jgi:hypothetical protein